MKDRIVRLTWLTIVLGLVAPPLLAERNLIPSLETIPDVCPERPTEPDWMENIALRDAYQRVLVQDIYRAQNMERVVETGSCDCATRFPTWDSAESTFRKSIPVRTVQTCCEPRTPTTAVQMIFDLKPKRSAKLQAIGREILK